jgi:hypothetical protein
MATSRRWVVMRDQQEHCMAVLQVTRLQLQHWLYQDLRKLFPVCISSDHLGPADVVRSSCTPLLWVYAKDNLDVDKKWETAFRNCGADVIVTNCKLPTTRKGIVTVSENMSEILPDFMHHLMLVPLPKFNDSEGSKTAIRSVLKELLRTNGSSHTSQLAKLVTIDGESLESLEAQLEIHPGQVSDMKDETGKDSIQQILEEYSRDNWIVYDKEPYQEEKTEIQIYLATKTNSDRSCKFKVFHWTGEPSIFDSSKEMADKFMEKIGVHANIIETHNIGPNVTIEETGQSWADLIDQKLLRCSAENFEVLLQNLCCAIKHLHGVGVVHGEVTPDSVLVRLNDGDDGSIKCAKFNRFQNAIWIANNGELKDLVRTWMAASFHILSYFSMYFLPSFKKFLLHVQHMCLMAGKQLAHRQRLLLTRGNFVLR